MIDHEWGFYETGYYSMHFVSKEEIIKVALLAKSKI